MPGPAAFPPMNAAPPMPQSTATPSSGAGDTGPSNSPLPAGIRKLDASGSGQIIVHPDEDTSLVSFTS